MPKAEQREFDQCHESVKKMPAKLYGAASGEPQAAILAVATS